MDLLAALEAQVKPYRNRFPSHARLPATGRPREEILAEIAAMQEAEAPRWREGYASGAVYHGDDEHIAFLNQVYALHSQSNPLHPDLWPSAAKFEAEIVAMTARMLNGPETACGTLTSGGTESLLLAMKTYRDWARATKGITEPEAVVPVSAHAAFDKAAQYFGIRLIRTPVGPDYRADVQAVREAITPNTVVIAGSAPGFPHGVIDPIPELAALAAEHGIGCHVDACLGGFVLPWAERLGYPVPPFDFRLPGVTSISADTHKYGYGAKGTSVILYRTPELLHHQYFTAADWPGGLYFSPTFAGSRPGALSATAWAAMLALGEEGYLEATRRILAAADQIKAGIRQIPGLQILGDPLWVIAVASDTLNIYQVMQEMAERGWVLNGLHRPPAFHIAVTLRHAQPGVVDRFLADLRAAVEAVAANPERQTGMAPVYGMAAAAPPDMVRQVLTGFIDLLYRV
ncbi:pyridoxal phosphate-dependent decarboxylase family protein [Symbiobacterium terraclitae]|uniref:pyridoxal phosphate-dependent decarboxylase family protein n=1 Tax=Symbiobacterium terraclitae TaxID=557451 RepID=UPI0035B53D0E